MEGVAWCYWSPSKVRSGGMRGEGPTERGRQHDNQDKSFPSPDLDLEEQHGGEVEAHRTDANSWDSDHVRCFSI